MKPGKVLIMKVRVEMMTRPNDKNPTKRAAIEVSGYSVRFHKILRMRPRM